MTKKSRQKQHNKMSIDFQTEFTLSDLQKIKKKKKRQNNKISIPF